MTSEPFISLSHFAYAEQPELEESRHVNGFGTPGEVVALSFSLAAPVGTRLPEVTLVATDLSGDQGILPRSCVDVYIVKVWKQSGLGIYQSPAIDVPELLVKDDRIPLNDGYQRDDTHPDEAARQVYFYCPPDLPLQGAASTNLEPQTTKQIWVSVRIQENMPAGLYRGAIEIFVSHERLGAIDVTVDVLPFRLLEARHDLLLWYRGTLDWQRSKQHCVSKETMRYQLQDIYDHGFRSISLNETNPRYVAEAIAIAESVGFKNQVLLHPPFPPEAPDQWCQQTTPVCYVSDELDIYDDLHIGLHQIQWKQAQQFKCKTMASVLDHRFTQRFYEPQDIGHPPDIISCHLPTNKAFYYFYANMPELAQQHKLYYYWMLHMEKPNLHRVLAGLYLWKSKADGISPYCYQHLPRYPHSPFDDFDEWEPPVTQLDKQNGAFRDHMATYPAREGTIGTLQWEGVREGITDLRYLTTLTALLEKGQLQFPEVCNRIQIETDAFLKHIDLQDIVINSNTVREPYASLQPEAYHQFRRQMANAIMELNRLLSKVDVPSRGCP